MLFHKKRVAVVQWARARAKLGTAKQLAKRLGLTVTQVYEITRREKNKKHAFYSRLQ